MSAQILDGQALAVEMKLVAKRRVDELKASGASVGLGTILVGDDGPSSNYVAMKHRDCSEVGIASFHRHLPTSASLSQILEAVDEFNETLEVSAFLVQLPLPRSEFEEVVLERMRPEKDVDGLHPMNLGKLVMSKPGPLPCTPAGILKLLQHNGVSVEGKRVVVVGRGLTVGRPLALLLSSALPGCNAAVTVVHSRVKDIGAIIREGEVVVSATGVPGIIKKEYVMPGAVVVGAGTFFEGRKLISDVEEAVAEVASMITPRIGGVGPMTRAMLIENTLLAATHGSS